MMRVHRLLATGLATLGMLGVGLAVSGATAQAGTGLSYQSQLKGFASPAGAAVDASGNVYVADGGADSVDKFNSSGAPASFSGTATYISASKLTGTPSGAFGAPEGVAVDASGNLYVTDGSNLAVDVFNSAGVYQRQLTGITFADPQGVTVDEATGEVYVADAGHGVIDVFNASGAYEFQFGSGILSGNNGRSVAVNNSTGEVYVADSGPDVVYVFNSSGALEATWTGGGSGPGGGTPNGSFGGGSVYVAVDQSTHRVYVTDSSHQIVDVFESSGNYLIQRSGNSTPNGSFVNLRGVAVDSSSHLYAIDQEAGVVDVFQPGPTPEAPITEAATGQTATTAVLHGELNPGANAKAAWYFAYNIGGLCTGGATSRVEPEAEVQAVKESKEVTGLEPSSQYTVCLVAENAFGPELGSPATFTTHPAAPTIVSESVSGLTPTGVTLEAVVNPNNQETTCHFQYGETTAYGREVPCEPEALGAGGKGVGANAPITGLAAGTTYHYRVVAKNTTGKSEGPDHTLTTQGAPIVSTGEATSITRTTATLSGTVNPADLNTKYYFEYISAMGYETAEKGGAEEKENLYAAGERTVPISAGSGDEVQAVGPILAAGLLPGITYHFRVVAENEIEGRVATSFGRDQTFTTASGTPPVVTTGVASNVTQATATITGTVTTNSLQTNYGFEIGTEAGKYGPVTGLGSLGGATTEIVTLTLTELQPGTTYHYRITATNADGAEHGADQTLTTVGLPTLFTIPTAPPLIATPAIAFPIETGTTITTTKALTNAQRRSKALKACRAKKNHKKRAKCEKQAQRKYGRSRRSPKS